MALGDEIKKSKEELEELNAEFTLLANSLSSLGTQIKEEITKKISNSSNEAQLLGRSLRNDISNAVSNANKRIKEQSQLISDVNKGKNVSKKIENEIRKIEKEKGEISRKLNILSREGINIDEEIKLQLLDILDTQLSTLNTLQQQNTVTQKSKSLFSILGENTRRFADTLDETGTLSEILKGNFKDTVTFTRLAEASLLMLVKGTLQASDNIANIAKNTGLSYQESRNLQISLGIAAANSDKLFITSKDLNQSFTELSMQTGLIADFGGDILQTQTTLTKQLKLSSEGAGKLSLLSRIQSTNTEGILNDTVSTIGAISKQNKVALNSKTILEEVSQVSDSIAVSLGMNPKSIAEAVVQAKLLGLSLSEVDAVASSLLDFESSITSELEAELLIGKDLNLERARLLALNNDLAGLGEELKNQEEIRLAFATGNRIQQEAAAKAIGLSRDQLAKITLQQEFNNLSAEQFKDTYGEITYQQLQSQSTSEKFASTLEKIQGIIGDIGTVFSPILDGFASLVGFLAKSKAGAMALAAAVATLASVSLAKAIADLYISFSQIPLGLGIPLAIGASAGLIATVASAQNMVTADDMIAPPGYGDRILSTPRGSIALNNQDTIVAGTNLNGGDNREAKRTNQLLEQILTKQGTVKIDSVDAGTAFAMNTYQVQ